METADIVALIVVALLVLSFWRVHRDPQSIINVFDLVMEAGRLSKMACAFWATFGVLSWIMVKTMQAGNMSVEYLASYGALFVAPIVAKMFSTPPPAGTTTTTTQSVVETTEPAKATKKGGGK